MTLQRTLQQVAMAFNSGSSSLKIGLFDISSADCKEMLCGSVDRIGRNDSCFRLVDPRGQILVEDGRSFKSQEQALLGLMETCRGYVDATPSILGHRIVHGGPELSHHQIVRRYGFHGISYESIMQHLSNRLPERAVFAHLGSGSNLCAVRSGSSIDTTMGMTPTGGVLMGTRSGDLDPGVVLFLLQSEHQSVPDLEELLNHRSGLSALSGGEADMKMLLEMRNAGISAAELALNAYATAIRKTIGAYAALLGGIDLLVFTGGIGEHSAEIRNLICSGLDFLGLGTVSAKVAVVPAQEEQQIARICRRSITSSKPEETCTGCQCESAAPDAPLLLQ